MEFAVGDTYIFKPNILIYYDFTTKAKKDLVVLQLQYITMRNDRVRDEMSLESFRDLHLTRDWANITAFYNSVTLEGVGATFDIVRRVKPPTDFAVYVANTKWKGWASGSIVYLKRLNKFTTTALTQHRAAFEVLEFKEQQMYNGARSYFRSKAAEKKEAVPDIDDEYIIISSDDDNPPRYSVAFGKQPVRPLAKQADDLFGAPARSGSAVSATVLTSVERIADPDRMFSDDKAQDAFSNILKEIPDTSEPPAEAPASAQRTPLPTHKDLLRSRAASEAQQPLRSPTVSPISDAPLR
jgi:hypothetical protein